MWDRKSKHERLNWMLVRLFYNSAIAFVYLGIKIVHGG